MSAAAWVGVCAALFIAAQAWAVDAQPPFKDPVLEQRYQTLIHEIRCLQCLDESIADSTSRLAEQMRIEIHARVAAGQSEKTVLAYFVSRYGDFVLYTPPVQPNTWLLWASPLILLVIGALVFVRVLRNRSSQPLDEDSTT